MRKRGRFGGSVVKGVLTFFVIYLIFTAAYYLIRSLGSAGSNSSNNGTPDGRGTATVSVTSSATIVDNMSLAQLQNLSFSNATKCEGLLHSQYWDTAMQASGKTTVNMIPNTVYGLAQSYNRWATFFRDNITNPPAWLSLGLANYTAALEARLAAQVMGTNNVTLAAAVLKNYTSYVSGLGATGVDFISFDGLSGLSVYAGTGNVTQAAEVTFPGQLYQLFSLSQDCSYSEQQRAEFLGTAMSMTALIVATSGRDGFGPKFEALLTKLGLHDSWYKIKFEMKDIVRTSPGAAYETTMVPAALAKKFPSDFNTLGPFTTDRIAVMVQVLKEKGLSADQISVKVGQLAQSVGESDEERHVADAADAISYGYEGSLRVTIDSDYKPTLLSQGGRYPVSASFLESVVPGFKEGELTALKVTVHKNGLEIPSYHVYDGGKALGFRLPGEQVQPGDAVGLSFELLPVEAFASEIPQVVLTNPAYVPWVADSVVLKDFKVVDGVLEFRVLQKNPWTSAQEFTVRGEVVKYPGVSSYGGVYAQFSITDYAGRARDLKLRYDGFSSPGLQLVKDADTTGPVSLVSYDGFRLSIVYGADNTVATIYLEPPSNLIYSLGDMRPYSGSYLAKVEGMYSKAFQIDSVNMPRDLEKTMLDHGSPYDHGRQGAEIAYVVGDTKLGLKSMILEEPNKGGRDLYTQDNKVAIQARFLVDFTGRNRETYIQGQILDLVEKLHEDYTNQPQMQDGYAILSYVDTNGTVKTIILEVPKQ